MNASSPQGGQAALEILAYLLGIIARRRSILILALVISVLAATAVSFTKVPVFEASSTLIADKSPPVVLLSNAGRDSSFVQQSLAQAPDGFTLTELVKSDAVRDAAINRLAAAFDPRLVKEILSKQLQVQQVRSTDLVRVSVRYRDPSAAAAMANAVAESMVEMDLRARRRQAIITRQFIGEQMEIAGRDLRAGQHALAAFKKETGDVSLSDETQLNLRKLADLEAELSNVRVEQQQVQSGFAQSLSASRAGTPQVVPDTLIATLQSQLASLEVEYTGLRKQFTDLHPQVLSTQAKIDETRRRLRAEFASKQTALATREQSLSAEIARLAQALMKVPSREARLARLTLDAKEGERSYQLLAEKFQEARIAEGSIGSSVRIVDVAKPSAGPVGPQRRFNIVVAMVLGLLLGIAGAYVTDQLDETIKSERDIEGLLGAPVLGKAPALGAEGGKAGRDGRRAPLLLTEVDRRSAVPEAFRLLRTHVLRAMERARSKCVLVAAAQPGQAKHAVVANLALTMAQTDRRVWLVECDLRRPSLARFFPEADSPGLSALLCGQATEDQVVCSTAQPGLGCVVGGAGVPDPTELLDTRRLTEFLIQARDHADVVLLDCPAIGLVADAEVAGIRSDGAILVVDVGKTTRAALARARTRLGALGVPVIGAVLNAS